MAFAPSRCRSTGSRPDSARPSGSPFGSTSDLSRLTSSKMILQSELDLAQLAGAADAPKAGGGRCALRAPACARTAPCRMVGSVEHLYTELERVPLIEPEVLDRRGIDVPCR